MRRSRALLAGLVVLAGACTSSESPRPGSSPSSGVSRVAVDGIRGHLEALQRIADANGGTRAVGTPGYDASVRYVVGVLRGAGYEVVTPGVSMPVFAQEAPTVFEQVSPLERTWTDGTDMRAMLYSASGDARAPVTAMTGSGCEAADFSGFPAGDVALLQVGPCLRREQVLNAQDAGASAVVVPYPTAPGRPLRPTLLYPDGITVPVLAVTGEVGRALASAAGDGSLVEIHVRTSTAVREVQSVIAQTPSGDAEHVVVLGAHLDSVMDGPGIDDNGSGVAMVLEVARWLAGRPTTSAVRFAFWAGEEEGLYGSRDYVDGLTLGEREAIDAYLNLDMVGSPNFGRFVYADRPDDTSAADESEAIERLFTDYFAARGLSSEGLDLGGGADHGPFAQAGIPVGGVFSGAYETKTPAQAGDYGGAAGEPFDACYHQACDSVANVSDLALRQFAGALTHALTELAGVGAAPSA